MLKLPWKFKPLTRRMPVSLFSPRVPWGTFPRTWHTRVFHPSGMKRLGWSGSMEQFPSLSTAVGEQPQVLPVSGTPARCTGDRTSLSVVSAISLTRSLTERSDLRNWPLWKWNALMTILKITGCSWNLWRETVSLMQHHQEIVKTSDYVSFGWVSWGCSIPWWGRILSHGTLKNTNNFQHKDRCQDSQ